MGHRHVTDHQSESRVGSALGERARACHWGRCRSRCQLYCTKVLKTSLATPVRSEVQVRCLNGPISCFQDPPVDADSVTLNCAVYQTVS